MWLWIAFSQFGDFPLWPVFGHDWNFVCCRTHCTAQKRKTEFNWNCCQVGTLNSNQNKNKRSESWQSLCKEGIPRKNVITIQTKINKQTKKHPNTPPPPQSTYSTEMNIHQNCIKPNHPPSQHCKPASSHGPDPEATRNIELFQSMKIWLPFLVLWFNCQIIFIYLKYFFQNCTKCISTLTLRGWGRDTSLLRWCRRGIRPYENSFASLQLLVL